MKPQITISTHNGGGADKISLAHNRREKWIVEKENQKYQIRHPGEYRIDPNGHFEIWKDDDVKEVYHHLFDDAVNDFNERQIKQRTPERQIKDYFSYIKGNEKQSKNSKKYLYEIIYTIGSKDNSIDKEVTRSILKEVADTFEKRNTNLYVTGLYYHQDEGGVPHLHLTYIPVAYNCKRGMSTQNSLTAALKQQGIKNESYKQTAQMAFERQENDYLEKLVEQYGFEVIHPQRGTKQEHLTIEEYRLEKEIETAQDKLEQVSNLPGGKMVVSKGRIEQLEQIEKEYIKDKPIIEDAKRELKACQNTMQAYQSAFAQLEHDKEHFDEVVNEEVNQRMRYVKVKAIEFIKAVGMFDRFKQWLEQAGQSLKRGFHQ